MKKINSKNTDTVRGKEKKHIFNRKMLIFIIILIIILNIIYAFIEREKLNNVLNSQIKQEGEEKPQLFSYIVYDNQKEDAIRVLVSINSESGIEYIKYPDNQILYANGKNNIDIDYIAKKNENNPFIIKESDKEEKEENLCITDEIIAKSLQVENKSINVGYKIISVRKTIPLKDYKCYYQIGKNGEWIEGTGNIAMLDYDIVHSTDGLLNDDNTVTITAKIENNGNIVQIIKNLDVDTKATLQSFEAESLLQAMEKYDFGTGKYKVKVKDATYSLKIYAFDENFTISENMTLGTQDDVGAKNEDAKNMVVLKVNGDLTVNSGKTLTAYANSQGYGGPKGMMVYCTGTIKNNGTITMTARGAKAQGQNVYLWKNIDNTYEYVPATGGAGGAGRPTAKSYYLNGLPGEDGNARSTGGGGSGAIYIAAPGYYTRTGSTKKGGQGTSYSGGAGSGGCCSPQGANNVAGGAPGTNGGAGGAGSALGDGAAAGGGAGNPGGNVNTWNKAPMGQKGNDGTGGLLIIYGNNIINNSVISSNGSEGGNSKAGGGSSGGGSVNIFYENDFSNTDSSRITATGGKESGGSYKGGRGGNGSVTIKAITRQVYEADSIIDAVKKYDFSSGVYKISVKGTSSEEKYNLRVYSYDGDKIIESNTTFGSEADVANDGTDAPNMIVLKVKGNLTINENAVLTTYTSNIGYGGPKGMMIYCTGTLTNKGKISMTARGARAEGQDVYLWKNADGSYEYVPAKGGAGGGSVSTSFAGSLVSGKNGVDGTNRATRRRRLWCSSSG